ncbi:MAG: TetR/AcrR family transcriptional regulator [Syntrophales bacterium]|nr:TetR/AcrR family transcriptional regulator [Syntrophales bacterium]
MGTRERRQKERLARIKQIRESAAATFNEKGFEAATMEEIAKRAEISKATIYIYFKSKEDLYYALIEPSLNKLSQNLIRISESSDNPETKIIKAMEATYAFYEQDPDAYHLVARYKAAEFSKLLSPEKLSHLKNLMRSNLKQVEKAICEGMEKGIFREVDPKVVSIIIWNTFMGVIQFQENRMMPGKSDYRKSTLYAAMEIILRGIRKGL